MNRREFIGLAALCGLSFGSFAHTAADVRGDLPCDGKTFRFASWNIGHFALGSRPQSKIAPEEAESKAADYRQVLGEVGADVIGICEYASNFTARGWSPTERVVFGDYPERTIGTNMNWRWNAVFSKHHPILEREAAVPFNATYPGLHEWQQGTAYTKAVLEIAGRRVVFAQVHLAWEESRLRRMQMERLILDLAHEWHVVIAGDFNVGIDTIGGFAAYLKDHSKIVRNAKSGEYEIFRRAGYTLGNDERFLTCPAGDVKMPLDNIIVRGLRLRDFRVVDRPDLSDHALVAATLELTEVHARVTPPLDPIVPYMYRMGSVSSTVADIRHIHARTGLRRFFLAGPGFNEVMYKRVPKDYSQLGKEIGEVKRSVTPLGIEVGFWCSPSIRYWDDLPAVVDAWGHASVDHKHCPLDPAFQADCAARIKSVAAAAHPPFINIEDDYTLAYGRGLTGGACFCKRHLADFAARYGKPLTGPEIDAAFKNRTAENLAIRKAWVETIRESLCTLARKIRAAVDEVDPKIRIFLCQPGGCDLDGNSAEAIARAFAGRTRPGMRPYGAIYGAQTTPAAIPGRLAHCFYTLEHTPKDVETFYEADPYPHNRFYTSAAQMASFMSGAIFAGSQDLQLYCLQYLDDPLEDPGYADAYNAAKPRLEAVRRFIGTRDAKLEGVRIVWRTEDISLTKGHGYGHGGQLGDGAFFLAKMGLPYTTREDAKGPAILAGAITESLSDDEIRALLAGGVLLDATAADDLRRRGFGALIGADAHLATKLPVVDETILPAAGLKRAGRHVNAFYIMNAGTEAVDRFVTLKPHPGTEVWSEFKGVDGSTISPSITVATNALGGRVAILAVSLLGNRASGLYNLRKQELLRNLCARLAPGTIPVAAVDAPGIWTLANVAADGKSMLVMVTNLSGDMRERTALAFGDAWVGATVSRLGADGRPIALGRAAARWQIPFALGQMLPEYLLVTRQPNGRGGSDLPRQFGVTSVCRMR